MTAAHITRPGQFLRVAIRVLPGLSGNEVFVRRLSRYWPWDPQGVAEGLNPDVWFNTSSWAPIAALRIGECYEQMKDWPKASAAYERAATSFANDAYARVLGRAFTSRTLEAQGRFDDSLSAAKAALNSWDADYGFHVVRRVDSNGSLGAPSVIAKTDDLAIKWFSADGTSR